MLYDSREDKKERRERKEGRKEERKNDELCKSRRREVSAMYTERHRPVVNALASALNESLTFSGTTYWMEMDLRAAAVENAQENL